MGQHTYGSSKRMISLHRKDDRSKNVELKITFNFIQYIISGMAMDGGPQARKADVGEEIPHLPPRSLSVHENAHHKGRIAFEYHSFRCTLS